jgi:hypothetical protein
MERMVRPMCQRVMQHCRSHRVNKEVYNLAHLLINLYTHLNIQNAKLQRNERDSSTN